MSVTQDFIINLGPTDTGLTLKAKLYDRSNSQVGSDITTGFIELGIGAYYWLYSGFSDSFVGTIRVYSGATFQAAIPFNAAGGDNSAVLAAIDDLETSLGAATITVLSPFTANTSNFSIHQGDDYNATLDNRISWSSSSWVDLTTATVKFAAKDTTTGLFDLEDITLSVANAGQATQTVRLSLTNAQTQALAVGVGKYIYSIEAIVGTYRVKLASGSMTVTEDIQNRA